jgi:hypothetical protein
MIILKLNRILLRPFTPISFFCKANLIQTLKNGRIEILAEITRRFLILPAKKQYLKSQTRLFGVYLERYCICLPNILLRRSFNFSLLLFSVPKT